MNVRRGGSRATATSKMERFVIIVYGFQPLTIITKLSILDVAAASRSASDTSAADFEKQPCRNVFKIN